MSTGKAPEDTTSQKQRAYYWTLVAMIAEATRPTTEQRMQSRIRALRRKLKTEFSELMVPEEDWPDEVRRRLTELATAMGATLPSAAFTTDPDDISWLG